LLAHGHWFSPGTPASSTIETGHHDIAEILLKVALNTKNHIKSIKSKLRHGMKSYVNCHFKNKLDVFKSSSLDVQLHREVNCK
jgi:hypothetical protein